MWYQFLQSFCPRIKQSGKSNQALHSEKRDGERLSRVILNLGMFSEVVCNRFTKDAYLPPVVCTVFGFARWLAMHSLRSVYIFIKPKGRCTSVVSTVHLLIGVEKKTWLISHFLDRRDRQPPGQLLLGKICERWLSANSTVYSCWITRFFPHLGASPLLADLQNRKSYDKKLQES